MGKRRKTSGHELLERLQGQENQNDRETLQDQPQQNIDDQLDNQFTDVDMTDNSIENDMVRVRGKSNTIKFTISFSES